MRLSFNPRLINDPFSDPGPRASYTGLILIILNSFSAAVNRNVESIFYSIKGSSQPDTNIVLIKITPKAARAP